LTLAAGASVVSVGTLAVAAMPASAPDRPACAVDPIFEVIERHRAACEAHTQAVYVECDFMEEVGIDLVNTKPATLAGIAALRRYVEPLFNEDDTHNLPQTICWDDDTESSAAGAFANAIAAAVKVLIEAQAGKAVQP
jgi:hypothetical protein